MKRTTRAQIAQETVAIADRGWYQTPAGQRVEIGPWMQSCLQGTRLYDPDELGQLLADLRPVETPAETQIQVTGETTLAAARRIVVEQGCASALCLNFASAKNPGGGFLGGSQAQEESLARSSGLYRSLLTQSAYYEVNRNCGTCLYTDHMILSPGVPVFRDDEGELLSEPYRLCILTAPAVNAGAIHKNEPERAYQIRPTLARRAAKLLAIAAQANYEQLILGAWGCGVFRNDPAEVASVLADMLGEPCFRGRFRGVTFAVFDTTPDRQVLIPFQQQFAPGLTA